MRLNDSSAAAQPSSFNRSLPAPRSNGNATLTAIAAARAEGLSATLINATGLPTDGCAGHPGVKGHRAMADAAKPLIRSVLGW